MDLTPLERACAYLDQHRRASAFTVTETGERPRKGLVLFQAGRLTHHAPTLAEAIMAAARALGWDPGQ